MTPPPLPLVRLVLGLTIAASMSACSSSDAEGEAAALERAADRLDDRPAPPATEAAAALERDTRDGIAAQDADDR